MIKISFFSNLYDKAKQDSLTAGFVIYILITFISVALNPLGGLFFFRDIDIGLGAFVGIVFALKFLQPEQSPIKYGIILGIGGGLTSSVLISLFYWVFNEFNTFVFFNVLILTLISGIFMGLFVGAILGWYYTREVMKPEKDYSEDDFLQDLVEKEKKEEKKKRQF